jgi:DNA-binding transcriptional ArsR family regulator
MSEVLEYKNAGWKIVQSISMELDAALAIAGGSFLAVGVTPDIVALQQANSDEWKKEWKTFYDSMNWYSSVMETASILTGVLEEPDYSKATMTIRQVSPEIALRNLQEMAGAFDLKVEPGIPTEEAITQLFVKYRKFGFEMIGFIHPNDPLYEARLLKELRFCLSIFQGGKYHDRFWHWLDHFYYEVYHPWHEEREPFLKGLEQKLITVLGTSEAHGKIADIQWLPELNPSLRYPEIRSAVESGNLFVNYWLEPFGFADTFTLLPGQFYPSFAEPGRMYENFMVYSRQLGEQVQALADPTRLIILRLIRALSMTNTDMAVYLGLSRPTVSIHAKILREAGLIRSWEDGRITRHEINPDAVRKLFHDLEEFLDLPPESPEN